MSLISDIPELKPGRGMVYGLSIAPGENRSARALDLSRAECDIRYRPVRVGEILGGTIKVKPNYTDLRLAFNIDGPSTIEYDGLSFGYEWRHNDEVISTQQWPEPFRTYIRSDQRWLLTVRLPTQPDREYQLAIWAEDHGERFDSEWGIISPRPTQPYASWTWDGDRWQSPEPFPTEDPAEGFYWAWDEASLSWIETEIPT